MFAVCEISSGIVKCHASSLIDLNITMQTYQITLHDEIKTLTPRNIPCTIQFCHMNKITKQHGLISTFSGKRYVCINAHLLLEGFIIHFIFPLTGLGWP